MQLKKQMNFFHLLFQVQEERSFPVYTGGCPAQIFRIPTRSRSSTQNCDVRAPLSLSVGKMYTSWTYIVYHVISKIIPLDIIFFLVLKVVISFLANSSYLYGMIWQKPCRII